MGDTPTDRQPQPSQPEPGRAVITCMITQTDHSAAITSVGGITNKSFLERSVLEAPESLICLTEDPRTADLIIFAETHHDDRDRNDAAARVIRSDIYRCFARKCVLHSGKDLPRPLLPGMYPSVPSHLNRHGCIGGPYLCDLNPHLRVNHAYAPTKLASFVGVCHAKPVRVEMLNLARDQTWRDIAVIDTSSEFIATIRAGDLDGHDCLKRFFADTAIDARFALCPKGVGLSSYRIFEAMQCARAPIIIADGWSPPPGPRWDDFAVVVAERRVDQRPSVLADIESEWSSRGRLAREAWERFFSPTTLGANVVRALHDVVNNPAAYAAPARAARTLFNTQRRLGAIASRLI